MLQHVVMVPTSPLHGVGDVCRDGGDGWRKVHRDTSSDQARSPTGCGICGQRLSTTSMCCREGEEGGISCGIHKCLSHSHTHKHTHTHTNTHTHSLLQVHPPPFYPSFGYPPPPPHPYAPPPPHYRYPPPPLLPDGPSSFYTPNPYPSGPGYGYNPRGPRPLPYSAPPFVPLQVWIHTHKR